MSSDVRAQIESERAAANAALSETAALLGERLDVPARLAEAGSKARACYRANMRKRPLVTVAALLGVGLVAGAIVAGASLALFRRR